MHREERDYWNSKYWFERAGRHPIHSQFEAHLDELLGADSSKPHVLHSCLDADGDWIADRFVDSCQLADSTEPDSEIRQACQQAKLIEWWLLMRYCIERATESRHD